MIASIASRRLRHQGITSVPRRTAAAVVSWLGAVQAQEYAAARWALALRMAPGTCAAAVERAFDRGSILRTHVMRPTWHFVAPRDIRWMLELTAPQVHRRMQPYNRHLELDASTLNRSVAVIERALGRRTHLTRLELGAHLARAGIAAKGQRLAHIALHAELEGVICSGPRRGRQFTYALLAKRAPNARPLPRDEALWQLARRFFRSHGPATVRDFAWWSGLAAADARRGLEMTGARRTIAGGTAYWWLGDVAAGPARSQVVHLLPIYDEYVVAYRDRVAVPQDVRRTSVERWSGAFQNTLVVSGRMAGAWRVVREVNRPRLEVQAARRLAPAERRALGNAAARYSRFLGAPLAVSVR